jgi:transcriptional regulator with XRE-family HTH domain
MILYIYSPTRKIITAVRCIMQRSYLRKTRVYRGLTAKKVANVVGVDEDHITRIERGIRNPSLDLALKLEKFYGIPIATLLKRDNEE